MSILENLIAMTIVVVALFASINVTLTSLEMTYDAKIKTIALTIASNKIEQLQSLPFSSSQLTAGDHSDSSVGTTYPGHNVKFILTWRVEDNYLIAGVKKVNVKVGYLYSKIKQTKYVNLLILLSQP